MRASMSCDRSLFGVLSFGVLSFGVLGCSPATAPVAPAKQVAAHADHDKQAKQAKHDKHDKHDHDHGKDDDHDHAKPAAKCAKDAARAANGRHFAGDTVANAKPAAARGRGVIEGWADIFQGRLGDTHARLGEYLTFFTCR